jgi:uncharacterized protein YdaU (DUF1376 family)
LEDGAYNRLMDQCYQTERPLPLDKKLVYRLARATSAPERKAVDFVLESFFDQTETGYVQKRVQAEIERYQEKQRKAKASAEARWNRPKADANAHANASKSHGASDMRTHSEGNAHQSPVTSHQSPDPNQGHSVADLPDDTHRATEAGQLSVVMRRFGFSSNPGDLRLQALAAQGVTADTMRAACEEARTSKPNEALKPGYVFTILERWTTEAAKLKANANTTRPAQGNERRQKASQLADRIQGKRHDDPDLIDVN